MIKFTVAALLLGAVTQTSVRFTSVQTKIDDTNAAAIFDGWILPIS